MSGEDTSLGSGKGGPLRLAGLLSEFFTAAIFPAFWASWESSEGAAGALSAPVFTLTFAPPAFQIYVSVPDGRCRSEGMTLRRPRYRSGGPGMVRLSCPDCA